MNSPHLPLIMSVFIFCHQTLPETKDSLGDSRLVCIASDV